MLHFGKIPKKNGEIWRKFSKIWPNLGKFAKFWKKTAKNSAIFNENFEIRERCKGVHCVDLGESFPTSIYLQKSASIQPRTSPSKFGGQLNSKLKKLVLKIKSIRSSKLKIQQPKLNHLAAKIKSFRKNAAFWKNPEKKW